MSTGIPSVHKPRGAPFEAGNPGRPKGARNQVTIAIAQLLEGEHEKLTRALIERALAGDMTALRVCLDRLAPPPKDGPIAIELPPVRTVYEAADASSVVVAAMAAGEITPTEAARALAVLTSHTNIVEGGELEKRLEALETASKQQQRSFSPYQH